MVLEKSGGIVYYKDNFLFMIPSNPDYGGKDPQIAKGRIENNEHHSKTALREIGEELGIINSSIGKVEYVGKFKTFNYYLHIYLIELNELLLKDPCYETKEVVFLKKHERKKIRKEQQKIFNHIIKRYF